MTHVLVTGGAGFIGSHIVDLLIAEGYEVTVVDNLSEQVHDGPPSYLNDHAEYVWGDVRDRELMTELLEKVDMLSHQASAVGVSQSMYEIEEYTEVNTLGTARILDIIANEEIDLEKIVVASSMSIYGEGQYYCPSCQRNRSPTVRDSGDLEEKVWDQHCSKCNTGLEPRPTPEDTQLNGSSIYAITKKTQEELVLSFGRAYDIPSIALRYFNVYGSRQSLRNPYAGVCAIFTSRIKNGNPPMVFEDGEQLRDFIHVSDVARANCAAIEAPVSDEAINIGTGDPIAIKDLAKALRQQFGMDDKLDIQITNNYRAGDVRQCYADPTKAKDLLGFEPTVDFESGLEEFITWSTERDSEDKFVEAYNQLSDRTLIKD